MHIEKEFSPKVIDAILPKEPMATSRLRTPLHVDFPDRSDDEITQAEQLDVTEIDDDPERFNAVGSRFASGANVHTPVIDIDGGAMFQQVARGKSKVIIHPAHSGDQEFPKYGPTSLIKDVLGDYGIDVEVFQQPEEQYASMMASYQVVGLRLTSLVLRSDDPDMFDAADSTQRGHNHLYIQTTFEDVDHRTLISELGSLGIVSRRWQKIVSQEGMGIVRTPWTEKAITHRPS
jgi:hypothetical protein